MIAVTGMHRSGTSCTAGLLEICGFSLGTSHSFLLGNAPREDNPVGHFELEVSYGINDEILRRAGGAWDRPPSVEAITAVKPAALEAVVKFGDSFNGEVFKDPRLSLTLDIWKQAVPSLKVIVLCLRHPLAVAASLAKREAIEESRAVEIWLEYNQRLLAASAGLDVHIIRFDSFADDVVEQIAALSSALGKPLSDKETEEEILEFYSKSYQHHRAEDYDLSAYPEAAELYAELMKSPRSN